MPGIGISLFVGAVGAILRYALTASTKGFNVHTGGVILMIAGAIGLLLSLLFWASFSPFSRRSATTRRDETISEGGHERATIVSETRDERAL
ncbi:MAG: hypothetical protein NVSMB57_04350 [Actinomycetota bacterium]